MKHLTSGILSDDIILGRFGTVAKYVLEHYGTCDSGLKRGELITESAISCLKKAIPNMFHNGDIPIYKIASFEVQNLVKGVDWKKCAGMPRWAISSANAFITVCVATGCGVIL